MRIPSNTTAVTPIVSQSTAVTATLETPARPLLSAFVSDFGNGTPTRVSAGYDTVEFVDLVKLKGHYSAASVVYLVQYDSSTYTHESTDFVPSLQTVASAGSSRPTQQSITGGPLNQADFNNLVNRAPNRFDESDRLAIDPDNFGLDTRSQQVQVDNIRDIMRELLTSTNVPEPLSQAWEDESSVSVLDQIEEYLSNLDDEDEPSIVETFQELRKKYEEALAYRQISGAPSQPEPVEDDTPTLEMLSPEEQAMVRELMARDQEVRSHEMAHATAGAGMASGATYTYQRGPDGKQYAIGGEVQIQIQPGGTPEETLRRAQQARAAATAPSNPSAADLQVAAMAGRMQEQAQLEMASRAAIAEQDALEQAAEAEEAVEAHQALSPEQAIGRLSKDALSQMSAVEEEQRQEAMRSEGNAEPTRLDLEREMARLTVAAPMGAYAEQFKMEQELDRRAFGSLELAQEVAGVPTPQVVEARAEQQELYEQRAERNAGRREEVEVRAPKIDIQPSGSADVEDERASLTADVEFPRATIQDSLFVEPPTFFEMQEIAESYDGLNANDVANGIPRSGEGLASEATEADPIVPMGVEQNDPFAALQDLVQRREARLNNILERTQDEKQKTIEANRNLSIQGNPNPVSLEEFSDEVLFQPEVSQLDFAEQVNTDGQLLIQASSGSVGPSRLVPAGQDQSRSLITPDRMLNEVETAQAIQELQEMFST
jgi:hypothetical protein